MASLDRADQDLAAGRARLLDDGLIASLPEDSRMTVIARDERRWTIESVEPLASYNGGDGNALVEGPAVNEAVEVVPASQLAGAVERMEQAVALLARVGVGGKPMAAKDCEDIQAAHRILTGGQ